MLWNEKRYYSLDYYIKTTYGKKLYKLSLDGGFTCPNRDGSLGEGGCIFCSQGGSGDFSPSSLLSINKQLAIGKETIARKSSTSSYIAYFQAFTNTYGEIDYLRKLYMEALCDPEVEILSIATRPDCLSDAILDLLEECNAIKPVWIELGLQSVDEKSADFIRRQYPLVVFSEAVRNLRDRKIAVIVHTIIGLPSEETDGILKTIEYLNQLDIQGIKLQLLHVLEHTDLADYYRETSFFIPTLEEYLELLGSCISNLRPDIVVHRITGDGPKDLLIAPLWTRNKRLVLNRIQQYLKEQDIWQGKNYTTPEEDSICQKLLHYTN